MSETWYGIRVVPTDRCPADAMYLHNGEVVVHPAYWGTLSDGQRREAIDKLKRGTVKIIGRKGELRVHQHSGYVQTAGNNGFFAVCATCGWQGSNDRPTREEAERDVTNHVAMTGIELAFGRSDHENRGG